MIDENKILEKINFLREAIYSAIKGREGDFIVSLIDKNKNILTKGIYGTGSAEYDGYVSFNEELKSIDNLTISHIKKWLKADTFSLYELKK